LDSPKFYHIASTITGPKGSVDAYQTPFGIRTLKWDSNKGLFLNGQSIEIQGMCNQQDYARLGTTLPDRAQYFRIEKPKEMGCNGYPLFSVGCYAAMNN